MRTPGWQAAPERQAAHERQALPTRQRVDERTPDAGFQRAGLQADRGKRALASPALQALTLIRTLFAGDAQADSAVPPLGFTARLTMLTAAAMALLAVFAVALALAAGRLAARWNDTLAQTATIRIVAPADQIAAQTRAVLDVLATTPGIGAAHPLSAAEAEALLAPWFGPDLPMDDLPIPQLVDLTETGAGYDAEGLRLRLVAEAPGAILDDHTRWRRPLVAAAGRLRLIGLVSVAVIALTTAAMVALAAQSALAANAQVIRVLRLVGARDAYIVRAFVRRFTLRTLWGALAGTALGMVVVATLPSADTDGGFLTGLGFQGWHWLVPLAIPILAALVAFFATRIAAFATVRNIT